MKETAKHEKEGQEALKKTAEAYEHASEKADGESEHSLHVHHQFAKAVTIFQVSIALAAVAALTRRRPMWLVSLAAGVVGLYYFVLGFGLFG